MKEVYYPEATNDPYPEIDYKIKYEQLVERSRMDILVAERNSDNLQERVNNLTEALKTLREILDEVLDKIVNK